MMHRFLSYLSPNFRWFVYVSIFFLACGITRFINDASFTTMLTLIMGGILITMNGFSVDTYLRLYGNWILNQTSSGPLSHDIALGSGWLQLNRHKDNKDIDPVALIPVFFIWYNWDRRIHWLTFFSLTALSSPATRFRVQLTKFAFRTLSSHNLRAELLNATIWNELTNPRYSLLCLNRFVLEATTEDNILTNNWTCETDHYQYRRKYVSSSLASTFWFMVWSHV